MARKLISFLQAAAIALNFLALGATAAGCGLYSGVGGVLTIGAGPMNSAASAVVAFRHRRSPGKGDYLAAAVKAAKWIEASAIRQEGGVAWPADPKDKDSVHQDVYSGVPGVVLFFLEMYGMTGVSSYLAQARGGADFLLTRLALEKGTGLYEGAAGIGFTLIEIYKTTRDERYRRGAIQCVSLIKEKARTVGGGMEWDDVTDIISGSAGTGLFLLYAARELGDTASRELAAQAGQRLMELGRPEAGGLKWAMSPKFPRLMPNFSHGTAGVCYFLATLYQETRSKKFLDSALAGARYLQSVARTDGDICLVFHNEPDGKDLYYLGWCHGPVGTARLFYRLYQATGDSKWMDWVKKSARAIMQSGIPDKQTPGFWNNVSQCCGSAGVAEFFLDLYAAAPDQRYLDFAHLVAANLLSRATEVEGGLCWVQAEHRIKPDLLVAQTGYMQGAAGIGMLLLHLDAFGRGKRAKMLLPDNPFRG